MLPVKPMLWRRVLLCECTAAACRQHLPKALEQPRDGPKQSAEPNGQHLDMFQDSGFMMRPPKGPGGGLGKLLAELCRSLSYLDVVSSSEPTNCLCRDWHHCRPCRLQSSCCRSRALLQGWCVVIARQSIVAPDPLFQLAEDADVWYLGPSNKKFGPETADAVFPVI